MTEEKKTSLNPPTPLFLESLFPYSLPDEEQVPLSVLERLDLKAQVLAVDQGRAGYIIHSLTTPVIA